MTMDTLADFLADRVNFESRLLSPADRDSLHLDRIRDLLDTTGIAVPGRILHVAGTNGKGSTCMYLEQGLLAAGATTGTFLSPHVETIRERFRINGSPVPERILIDAADTLIARAGRDLDGCTTFEVLFLLASLVFTATSVEWTVLETGLGGRLDTTNVVTPEAALITPISLDHTAILGSTLPEIAGEKAGIIKEGVPCFSAAQDPSVLQVLRATAERLRAPFEEIPAPACSGMGLSGVSYRDGKRERFLRMPGAHQAANCHLALTCLDRLGITPDEETLARRLAETSLPARMEFFPGPPQTLLDGGHNPAAAATLARLVGRTFPRVHAVTALQRDKESRGFFRELDAVIDHYFLTGTGSPRSTPPESLRENCTKPASVYHHPEEALQNALEGLPADGLVIVCGSFYLAGLLRGMLTGTRSR